MTPSLTKLIAKGESATLELKRSTGELREALQTLCAFANGKGGRVIIGVKPNGELIGQQVSEQTFHEIAAARERFEPPIEFEVESVKVAPGRNAIVLTVAGARDAVPFTFDGRAFERVGNTTRKMPQERYEALLLERGQSRRRWENQAADELVRERTSPAVKAALQSLLEAPIAAGTSKRAGSRKSRQNHPGA